MTHISTDIDFDRDGKQVSWLALPHSVTRSAYGRIAIPIAVIKNGAGPTAFFMAGNHGDEYEGQIALCKLIRALEPSQIVGRAIVLPAANLPAALAGTRVSPIDDGNLNRAFPGSAGGSVTWQIAHYIDSVLFPMADLFFDLHSGGSSLDYLPFASVHEGPDAAINARSLAALEAFNAPISIVWRTGADPRYSPGAAMKRGVPALGSEFGGGGGVSRAALADIERGLPRLLAHLGMTGPDPNDRPRKSRRMDVLPEHFVYAPEEGLFEPANDLGDTVAAGQLCGHVHFVDNPARPPEPCRFAAPGFVICKRHFGRVVRGDCVAHLAIDAG